MKYLGGTALLSEVCNYRLKFCHAQQYYPSKSVIIRQFWFFKQLFIKQQYDEVINTILDLIDYHPVIQFGFTKSSTNIMGVTVLRVRYDFNWFLRFALNHNNTRTIAVAVCLIVAFTKCFSHWFCDFRKSCTFVLSVFIMCHIRIECWRWTLPTASRSKLLHSIEPFS